MPSMLRSPLLLIRASVSSILLDRITIPDALLKGGMGTAKMVLHSLFDLSSTTRSRAYALGSYSGTFSLLPPPHAVGVTSIFEQGFDSPNVS